LRELSSPIIPEFFVVFGINVFLVTSLLTCLLDFPVVSQYIYQLAALAGFGQLWANLTISSGAETRFWLNVVYLAIALVNVVVVNAYIAAVKKQLSLAGMFLAAVTVPVNLMALLTLSSYVNRTAISIPLLPVVPMEAVAVVLIICGVTLAASAVTSFKLSSSSLRFLVNKRTEVKKWKRKNQRRAKQKKNK
jgi:hypothetical protein